MWGHKERVFYRFSEVINGCGISAAGLDNCILSGLIRVHTWFYPVCVYQIKEVRCGSQVLLQTQESVIEGYVALETNDYRRILQRGRAGLRIFSIDDEKYCLRCGLSDIEVNMDDLVILASEKEKIDHYLEQQTRADHTIGMLSSTDIKADTTFDPALRHVTFRGREYAFGAKQALIVRLLYEAAKAGDPWQNGKKLLKDAGSESFHLRSVFSRQAHWRELIMSDGRGLYRLHEDFPLSSTQD